MTNMVSQFRDALAKHALVETRRPRSWESIPKEDQGHILRFVDIKGGNKQNTFRRYFRTIAQFMTWLDKPLVLLTSLDMRLYQRFLASPSESFQRVPDYPFKPGNDKTIDSAFDVLKTFCTFLVDEGVLANNPAKNVQRLIKGSNGETKNYFPTSKWNALWDYMDHLPTGTRKEHHAVERLRYCINLQYGLALRPEEMAHHDQSSMFPSGEHWKIEIQGKGNKKRLLTVSDDTLQGIARYNQFLGLPDLPHGRRIPFLPKLYPVVIKTRGPNTGVHIKTGMTETQWQFLFKNLMKQVFRSALQISNEIDLESHLAWKNEWSLLSPHGLRHTRLTHLVKQENWDVFSVMKYAGHTNLNTTQVYFHLNINE